MPWPAVSVIGVPDTAVALRAAARQLSRDASTRSSSASPVRIAKTSTKELVGGGAVGALRACCATSGNENNEIGLPLTLLRLRQSTRSRSWRWASTPPARSPLLAGLARPSIGVVTAVRGVHLSRAGSIEAIEAGKRELVEALPADWLGGAQRR